MPQNISGDEMDKMTADAIKRARQMFMRSSLPQKENSKETISPTPKEKENISHAQNLILEKLLGGDIDRLIIIILILLLRSEKENLPTILALLYILM